MKVTFVRHPQTTWNVKSLFQGTREGSVTPEGKTETTKFVSNLSIESVDKIYSANNKRCLYLANELSKKYSKALLLTDSRLNERSFGDLEGTSELKFANNTDFIFPSMEDKYKWRPQNGESLEDVSIRVKDFLDEIKINKNETLLVVTSGGVLKTVSYILGIKALNEAMTYKIKNLETMFIEI